MSTPVYVMPPVLTGPGVGSAEIADLLRQLLAAQQEQVSLLKAQLANQDSGARWRSFLARWADEFPGVGGACKQVMPALERAYLTMIRELTDRLAEDADALADEFTLTEFLDKYGMKLTQMGNIVNQLTPLADASSSEKG